MQGVINGSNSTLSVCVCNEISACRHSFSLPHILLCRTDFSKHNQVFNSGVKMSTRAILFILAEMRIKLLYNRMPNTRSIFTTYFKVDQLWSFQA